MTTVMLLQAYPHIGSLARESLRVDFEFISMLYPKHRISVLAYSKEAAATAVPSAAGPLQLLLPPL